MKFDQYDISPQVKRNLSSLGFKRPTDIQYKTIPSIMRGEDVLAIAQTGTGKTAAFAIPLIDHIQRIKTSRRSLGIKCLVMVPTRELAEQIGGVFNKIAKNTRVKAFSLHGGIEQDPQIAKLQEGMDILIATPGRMFDLISQGFVNLEGVDILVLDEADHMLDLGFIDDIKAVKRKLPQQHQTLFFSATINKEIKKLAYSQVKASAIRIQISPDDPVAANVSHYMMNVEMDDKRFFLERFVHDHEGAKVLVFVRTRVRAERVVKAMQRVEIEALSIHGEKDQKLRSKVLQQFRDGECRLLVATDVSARGIDIPDVDYVINYDLPDVTENYVHRVGRTGRGTNKGIAISFCAPEELPLLEEIEGFLGNPIELIPMDKRTYRETVEAPSADDDLLAMIEEHEAFEAEKKKKKAKVKASKKAKVKK